MKCRKGRGKIKAKFKTVNKYIYIIDIISHKKKRQAA